MQLIPLSKSWMLYSISMLAFMPAQHSYANPESGEVKAGAAIIAANDKTLTVHQQSDKAVIDWRSFNIAPDEHTKFQQPSANATVLNRVTTPNPSHINGKLTANGNVVLVNPNGVFFGRDAKVDVNRLIATTVDIDNQNFMAGKMNFNKPGKPDAAIVNEGNITAKEAGLVALVAPNVINHGVIKARLGKVELASGDSFAVDMYGDGLYELKVSDKVVSQLVSNTGTITTEGGTIAITAAAGEKIVNSLIHIEGELKAPTIQQQGGKIVIAAEGSNAVKGNKVEDKNKKQGSSAVIVANASLNVSGRDKGEQGGEVSITADNIHILQDTWIDASGYAAPLPILKPEHISSGTATLTANKQVRSEKEFMQHPQRAGGSIKIGGDYLGKGDTPAAKTVYIDPYTVIVNDAMIAGDGGRTIIWSDDSTYYYGNVFARGGMQGGHGGFLETSGKQYLDAYGSAELINRMQGYNKGTYLLDPANITIYGDVAPDYQSTDGAIYLSGNVQLWLDASDQTYVTLSYSTDGLGGATASGVAGSTTLTTSADVSNMLNVGARIRLGAAGSVTTADTMGADTYTITSISGTTLTLSSPLATNYTATGLYRGLVSRWNDKSGNGANFFQNNDSNRPLWASSASFGNNQVIQFIRTSGAEDYLGFNSSTPGYAALNNGTMEAGNYWIQAVAMTNGGGTDNFTNYWQAIFMRRGNHNGLAFDGYPTTTNLAFTNWNSGNGLQQGVYMTASAGNTYVAGGGLARNGSNYTPQAALGSHFATGTDLTSLQSSTRPYGIGSIGPTGYGYDYYMDGAIPEIIVYNTSLSTNARNLIEQYQSAKWSVGLNPLNNGATEIAQATASIQKGDAADGYSVFSARYLERLSDTADIVLHADNNITLDMKGDTLNLANNRSITLRTDTQDILTASNGMIQTSGTGNITFNAGRDINIAHAFFLQTQGGNITLNANTNLDARRLAMQTNGGAIDLDAGQDIQLSPWIDSGAGSLTADAGHDITLTAQDVTTGLVGHWTFDEGSGAVAGDSAGNNDGTITGDTIFSADTPFSRGNSLRFDGNGDYVNITDNPSYHFGNSDFTASYWVKQHEVAAAFDNVWGVGQWNTGASAGSNQWSLSHTLGADDNLPSFSIESGNTSYYATSSDPLIKDKWHFLTGVREGGNIKLYLDGTLKSTVAVSTASINNLGRNLKVAASDLGLYDSNAQFDDVRLYNIALNADQIIALQLPQLNWNTSNASFTAGQNINLGNSALNATTLNFDASGTIVANVNTTNVNIGNNAIGATLTGQVNGGVNQSAANMITGGPGNNAAYTFEGFTIRYVAPNSSSNVGGALPSPAVPVVVLSPTPDVTSSPELLAGKTPIIEQNLPAAPVSSVSVFNLPNTVVMVSQNPKVNISNNSQFSATSNVDDKITSASMAEDQNNNTKEEFSDRNKKLNISKNILNGLVQIHPTLVEYFNLETNEKQF